MFQASNTEYLPTKCRVTRPPPPKPATNPLQFVKVDPPSFLYQKAQEQIKKVEEIKQAKQEVREEAEDWQSVSLLLKCSFRLGPLSYHIRKSIHPFEFHILQIADTKNPTHRLPDS